MALIVHSMSLRNLRRKVRICSVWVLAVCFALLAPSPILTSAWSAFPCEDVDNNGFCVPGVDRDITEDLLDGFIAAPNIVIPEGIDGLKTRDAGGFTVVASNNITVNSNLVATKADILLIAGGAINIGDDVKLKAGTDVDLQASSNIVIGSHTRLIAGEGWVYLYSSDGSILLEEGVKLFGTEPFLIRRIVENEEPEQVPLLAFFVKHADLQQVLDRPKD